MAAGRAQLVVNALAFQAVWFACILGASFGHAWPGVLAASAFAAATLAIGPSTFSTCGFAGSAANASERCCKVCSKGKACGNSCINRSYTCTKPPGCACDAN